MHTLENLSPALTREIYAELCTLLPPPNPDVEAERYAVIYPDRAVRIRAAGG